MRTNLMYQTAPFGGNNPIFIPFEMSEQIYEERLNNWQQDLNEDQQQAQE